MKNQSVGVLAGIMMTLLSMPLLISLVAPQRINMEVIMPTAIRVDHTPFDIVLTINNLTDEEINFDGTVFVFGEGWGGENYPYSFSEETEIYWMECNTEISQNGCKYWWRGTIAAKSAVKFTLPTFSGGTPGKYDFLKVLISTSERPLQKDANITIAP